MSLEGTEEAFIRIFIRQKKLNERVGRERGNEKDLRVRQVIYLMMILIKIMRNGGRRMRLSRGSRRGSRKGGGILNLILSSINLRRRSTERIRG